MMRATNPFSPRWSRAVLALLCVGIAGCGYPEVSPRTYEITKAMYRVCNLKEADRLESIAQLIEESRESGEITKSEAELLTEILEKAKADEWDDCSTEVRKLMIDQTDL